MTVDSSGLGNVRRVSYYKDLGAVNNVIQYSRDRGATKNVEPPSEDKQVVIKAKLDKWEKLFEKFEGDSDASSGSIKWGAAVTHDDYQGLQEATDELVKELGTKITDENSAKAISKLLFICGFRAEVVPEELLKVQEKAFAAVSDVLSNLKGKINPDLRHAVLQLLDPRTNNDFDAKAAKLEDLVDTVGPYDLVKRNSKTLATIQNAFDISLFNGSENVPYKDEEGNTLGEQVRYMIEMYKSPVLDRFTDIDGESNQLSPKGNKAFKGIRTEVVNAAMSQAQDTPSIMRKFQSKNDQISSSFIDGTNVSYLDYAQERLTVTRNFYIDPTAENREALVKHFAKFAAEYTKAQQNASVTDAAKAAIDNLKGDRKFNSIVIYPPELIKSDEAKESLKATAAMKVERISNLEETKRTLTSLSADTLLQAFNNNKAMGGTAANQASIQSALKQLIANNRDQSFSDIESFKTAIQKVVHPISNGKILDSSISEDTLTKIYGKAKEVNTRDIDELISKETLALKELLGLVNYSQASFDKSRVKTNIDTYFNGHFNGILDALNTTPGNKAESFTSDISSLTSAKHLADLQKSLQVAVSDNTILNKDAFKAAIATSDLSNDVKAVIAALAPSPTDHITTKIINTAIEGLAIDSTGRTTLQNFINGNKKSASEDDSIARDDLLVDIRVQIEAGRTALSDKIYSAISSESTPAAAVKVLNSFQLTHEVSGAMKDFIEASTITNGTSSGTQLDCTDTEAVKTHIQAFNDEQALALMKKAGVDTYKIIKAGESLSKYSSELSAHSRTQTAQLNFLTGVESGLAELFMENFTRSGVAGIATAVFGALEATVINNGNLQSTELATFAQNEIANLIKPHNDNVKAYKASHSYIQAQQSGAYKEALGKIQDKYSIGGAGYGIEDQIQLILPGDDSSGKSRIELFQDLLRLVRTAREVLPENPAFNISDEVEKIILKPDYKDASYREKQEIEVNKLLLKFVGALQSLTSVQTNKIADNTRDNASSLQESLHKVRELAAKPNSNVQKAQEGAKKLETYASDIKKVYGKFLEGEEDVRGLRQVSTIDELIDQAKELKSVKIGTKNRFLDTGLNFLRNLVSSIFISTTNGNKENLSRLATQIKDDHGDGALSSNQNLTGVEEIIRQELVTPSVRRR